MITAQSEFGKIKRLLLKHARDAFRSQEYIDQHWQELNYLQPPDFDKAVREYDTLVEIFRSLNIDLEFLPFTERDGMDSIYVRDASIVSDAGHIICNMGKARRANEPRAQLDHYLKKSDGILASCQAPATIEGGDVAWISDRILSVAEGYRTNRQGIDLLQSLVQTTCDELLVMHSPHYKGPSDVFHLMSVFSPVARDLAVVYSPLMSVPFRNRLLELGMRLIEVPENEFESLGCNVLAVDHGVCLMAAGNPVTRQRIEAAGVQVIEFQGDEICLKGSGGPTCLTRPLLREI